MQKKFTFGHADVLVTGWRARRASGTIIYLIRNRLDLRIDKSWQFSRWKLGLYGELLNATNHYNPVFSPFDGGPPGI
jgi:hypothetical protein